MTIKSFNNNIFFVSEAHRMKKMFYFVGQT